MAIQKNIINRFPAIVNQSMGASITQAAPYTNISFLDNIGIQITWTSANAIGTFSIQCSNNYDPDKNITGTWVDLTFSPVLTAPASNNGDILVNINQCPHSWIRVVYNRTSGTGTLNVWINAKEI